VVLERANTTTAKGVGVWGRELGPLVPPPVDESARKHSPPRTILKARRALNPDEPKNVRAAIWAKDTPMGVRHNATVSRTYKDGDQGKTSGSFGRDDPLLLAKMLDLAHTWISKQTQGPDA
jgi:hypothetical protein